MATELRPDMPEEPMDAPSAWEARLAKLMPWAISLFLHVGLAMVLMLAVMVVVGRAPDQLKAHDVPLSPEWDNTPVPPGAEPPPSRTGRTERPRGGMPVPEDPYPRRWIETGVGKVDVSDLLPPLRLDLIAPVIPGSGGNLNLVPGQGFFGEPGPGDRPGWKDGDPNFTEWRGVSAPRQVVFVIDRSGSMVENMDRLKQEMSRSIAYLRDGIEKRPGDCFHVIFFASGPPLENPPRKLVPAIKDNKLQAAEFLVDVLASGQTDPVPAMKRAFEVLRDSDRPGVKMVYFLTDGVFPDDQAVLKVIKDMNVKKDVHIYTFLYGHRPEGAEQVMNRIASQNGGRYKYVNPDE